MKTQKTVGFLLCFSVMYMCVCSNAAAQEAQLEALPPAPVVISRTAPAPAIAASVPSVATPSAASPADSVVGEERVPSGSLQRFGKLSGSLRFDKVASDGYDAFAKSDVLGAFSIDYTHTVLVSNRWSLALGGQIDLAGSISEVRGFNTQLGARRFLLVTEARYHLHPRLYGYGKIAPGATWLSASLSDPSSALRRNDNAGIFTGDLALGAAFLVSEAKHPDKHALRLWFAAEGGLAVSSSHTWSFTTGKNDSREGGTQLGTISLTAPMMRFAVAASL
jgi:hypothetical protein